MDSSLPPSDRPPSPGRSSSMWQPEGSWIMLDEQQKKSEQEAMQPPCSIEEEDVQEPETGLRQEAGVDLETADLHVAQLDLETLAAELNQISSNVEHLDARNSMEQAELSLGLNVRLGIDPHVLSKTSELVEAVSLSAAESQARNGDHIHLGIWPSASRSPSCLDDGAYSPSNRSLSSSSSSSSDDDHPLPEVIDSTFSVGGTTCSRQPQVTDKYGGRAPPVLGALAPPVRGFNDPVENLALFADTCHRPVVDDDVAGNPPRIHDANVVFSWVHATAPCTPTAHDSPSRAQTPEQPQHQDSQLTASSLSLDTAPPHIHLPEDGEETSCASSTHAEAASDGGGAAESVVVVTETDSMIEFAKSTQLQTPTKHAAQLAGEAEDTEVPLAGSAVAKKQATFKGPRKTRKDHKVKKSKKKCDSSSLINPETSTLAYWAYSLGLRKRMTLKTVMPMVVTHVVTLLIGFYIGRQYTPRVQQGSQSVQVQTAVQ